MRTDTELFIETPADGSRGTATVNITDLKQECWKPDDLPILVPATLTAKSIQLQVNADPAGRTDCDFCISKWTID